MGPRLILVAAQSRHLKFAAFGPSLNLGRLSPLLPPERDRCWVASGTHTWLATGPLEDRASMRCVLAQCLSSAFLEGARRYRREAARRHCLAFCCNDTGPPARSTLRAGSRLGSDRSRFSHHAQPCSAQMPPLMRRAAKLCGVQPQVEQEVHARRNHRLS
jgi:hypothetical protein